MLDGINKLKGIGTSVLRGPGVRTGKLRAVAYFRAPVAPQTTRDGAGGAADGV